MVITYPREIDPGDVESIAEMSLPVPQDDSKQTKYTYLRAMGFTKPEAMELTPISQRMVAYWYEKDEEFRRLDSIGIRDLRQKFAAEAISVEFTRNLAMVFRIDREVLEKAMKTGLGPMSKNDFAYLRVIRSHYTPDQLVKMMKVAAGDISNDGSIDLTNIIINLNTGDPRNAKALLEHPALQDG